MRVLFAASEAAPFAKTGGLGDVAGSLPAALAARGHDVRLVLPRYRAVDPQGRGLTRATSFTVPVASWQERCDVLSGRTADNVTTYFIEKDVYFDRPELYGTSQGDYPDNAERFLFFSRAVLELCRATGFRPDIIHCNDWQTGLTPLYLRKLYAADRTLQGTATIFTVHNLGYQGLFPPEVMRLTGLGWDVFTQDGIEFWGKVNYLKAGLSAADIITTVSPTYSREIRTHVDGHGLEGMLAKRAADLRGILNGIDLREWDPRKDRALPTTYSISRLAGKKECRKELRRQLGLPSSLAPLAGMVSRIVEQKGVAILAEALPEILSRGVQVAVLGTGDLRYQRLLEEFAARHPDRMRFIPRFDDGLARLLYAASDLFLMPSRYEPCGLGQMIALRYGAVPVVRRTGGLNDTVVDHDLETGDGTGFMFDEYTAEALAACVLRAADAYQDRRAWTRLMQAGMRQDFSWDRSAKEYEKVYREAVRNKRGAGYRI